MFAIAFVVIAGAQALKGHTIAYAVTQGLIWGALSSMVYVLAAIYRWRKAIRCAVARVEAADESIGAHLRRCVHTGVRCAYWP